MASRVMTKALSRAIARASAAVDRSALRVMERRMAPRRTQRLPTDARRRLIALGEHYGALATENVFRPPQDPAEMREQPTGKRLENARIIDLSYPSTYRVMLPDYREEHASHRENLTAHARWYRHPGPARPVAMCIHGWGGGAYWLEERAFVVTYLLRLGVDVVLVQLPHHGNRATRSGALFPSTNVVHTNEAFGQAIHDLRALRAFLRSSSQGPGAPAVGVMGMSLGGYTTALWASLDADLDFAIPIIPAVSMSSLMWRHGSGSPARRRAEKMGIGRELLDDVFRVHSPLARPVAIDRERLLIVAGRGDRITPPDQAESLWRHWGEPEISWFAGGHLAQIGRGEGFRAIRRTLERISLIQRRAS